MQDPPRRTPTEPTGADPSELTLPIALDRARGELLHRLFGDARPERRLGRYVLEDELGRGGMGTVYLGHDPELGRKVAIKVLRRGSGISEQQVRRIQREARAMARVAHPNVVEVFDVGISKGHAYVVMEYAEGGTLQQWWSAQPRSQQEIVAALLEAGQGLAAAHASGLLHRDFKPANVLVARAPDGSTRMRVADFGLAVVGQARIETGDALFFDACTTTHGVGGTPAFMPPEQHEGKPLDVRADVYALCASAHYLLCGALPFEGPAGMIHAAKLRYDGRPPRGSTVSPKLYAVIARGLHPDPAARWPSMDDLCDALRRAQRGRRAWPFAVGVVLAGGLGWLALPTSGKTPCDGRAALAEVWSEKADVARRARSIAVRVGEGETIVRELDDYAARWIDAYDRACDSGESERQAVVGCLQRDRSELAAVVRLLGEDARDIDHRARDLVAGLPDPAQCLSAPAEKTAASDDTFAAELGEAKALERAGRHEQAAAIATSALEHARRIGDARLVAHAALLIARLDSRRGRHTQASARANEALMLALANGDDDLVAQTSIELVWIEGVDGHDLDAALAHARRAEAMLERLEDPKRRRASLHDNLAAAWADHGDLVRARDEMTTALELLDGGDEGLMAATIRFNLHVLELHIGDCERAREGLRTDVALREQWYGADHPDVAHALLNLASAELECEDGQAARRAASRAVESARASVGADHPTTLDALAMQAHVLLQLGDVEPALAAAREAHAGMLRLYGKHDPQVAAVETRMAELLARTGEWEEAIALAEHARLVQQEHAGSDSPAFADATYFLARVLGQHGDPGARALFEQAAILFAAHGEIDSAVAVRNDLALILAQRGRLDEAREELARTWPDALMLEENSVVRAGTALLVAELDDTRPIDERRKLAARARDIVLVADVDPEMLAHAEAVLAKLGE